MAMTKDEELIERIEAEKAYLEEINEGEDISHVPSWKAYTLAIAVLKDDMEGRVMVPSEATRKMKFDATYAARGMGWPLKSDMIEAAINEAISAATKSYLQKALEEIKEDD